MISSMSPEVAELFARAAKRPLFEDAGREATGALDRAGIESLLPHRGHFAFLHAVSRLDAQENIVVAHCDLERSEDLLAGHFPGFPIWPGVLQIEMVGQAASLLYLRQLESNSPRIILTHVFGARFLRPIPPRGQLDIVAKVVDEGLCFTAVGQCLSHEGIASAVAVSGFAETAT